MDNTLVRRRCRVDGEYIEFTNVQTMQRRANIVR